MAIETPAPATNQSELQPEFGIQRIYIKDISFEAPNTPQIFTQDWQPELKLELQTASAKLDNDIYEVTITATATVNSKDKVAFLVEVKQSGIFSLKNFSNDQLGPMLGVACPSIIFPYAREVISDVVVRGGFPQLCLAPVNFDALYAQHLEQQASGGAQGDSASGIH